MHDNLESLQTSFDEIKDKHGNIIIEIQNMIKDKDRTIDEKQQEMEEDIGVMIKENIKQHEDGTAILANLQIHEGIVQPEARTDAKFERSKEDTGRSPTIRLLSPKETTIPKLEETANQADFVRWVEELYIHLENIGWKGISAVLKRIRKEDDPVIGMPESIIDEVHSDETNIFDKEKLNPKTIDDELYSYIIRKLNNKLKGLVTGITSGFEVFRVVVREMDPITKSTKKGLLQNS